MEQLTFGGPRVFSQQPMTYSPGVLSEAPVFDIPDFSSPNVVGGGGSAKGGGWGDAGKYGTLTSAGLSVLGSGLQMIDAHKQRKLARQMLYEQKLNNMRNFLSNIQNFNSSLESRSRALGFEGDTKQNFLDSRQLDAEAMNKRAKELI